MASNTCRIAAWALPSARRIAPCLSPSAVRIWDCLTPSAVRIAARRSRSARICCSIEPWMDDGGSIDFSSTRLTHTPAPRRLVQDPAQLAVDLVPAGQRLLEVHRADDVTQRGDRELFDALDV